MLKAKLAVLSLLLFAGVPLLIAQENEVCSRYQNLRLPLEAENTSVPKESPTCESYKSYAGIGRDPNYATAFACAWKERAAQAARLPQNPKSNLSWVVGGSLILTDLYANGLGASQNIPLAIYFACEDEGAFVSEAFDDLESRIVHPKTAKPFELCDYGATTFEMNFCASYSSEKSKSDRDRTAAEIWRSWPSDHKAAFLAAKKTYENYVDTVARDETYMGGTIRTIRALSTADALQEDFAAALKRFESGNLPHASDAEYRLHDADLNRIYQQALVSAQHAIDDDKANNLQPEEEIQPDGIRKTERAWLLYRDAFLAFATLHYPAAARESWLDELTQSRVHRLLLLTCNDNSHENLCTTAIRKEIESDF